MLEFIKYILALTVCSLPDLLLPKRWYKISGYLRAYVIGLGKNRNIGKGVYIKSGFKFPKQITMVIKDGCQIKENVVLIGQSFLMGENSLILSNSRIDCIGGVTVGTGTQIGRNNEIYSHKHMIHQRDVFVFDAPEEPAPTTIGDDVMLFSNVKVMPGINIEKGVVVMNSAVVTRDLQEYGIYGGLPALKVSERK